MNGLSTYVPIASKTNLSQALCLYPYDPQTYGENRKRVVAQFREDETIPGNSFLLLQGGKSPERYDTDYEPVFRQESNFSYLSGVKEPDCYLVISVDSAETTLFVPRLPETYAIWMGRIRELQSFKDEYKVDHIRYSDELVEFFGQQDPAVIYTTRGYNADSGRYAEEAYFDGIQAYRVDNGKLYQVIESCRVIKTKRELRLLAHINRITCEAHIFVMQHITPGMKEFQLESMFRHWGYFRGQCRHTAYTSICGSGPCGAHLHYGHAAAPNDRTLEEGDICLLDMGAEFRCYTSDVTCTIPASGRFTTKQSLIYNAVLDTQRKVMEHMKPGVSYVDMHKLAYENICEHLMKIGILKGNVQEMVENDLGAVFMPHGLGHFMGLDTHDVGGRPKHLPRQTKPGFASLRCIRTLEEGMVLTVEPGIYFNDYCLDKALTNPEQSKFLNPSILEEYRGFGGVRIEDDVVVTADGIVNLTDCPRTVEEIEATCAGKEWRFKGNQFLQA